MALESSIRNNYASMGVTQYYVAHGDNYKNPHEPKIKAALNKLLFHKENKWLKTIDFSYILDLCCGSGEMTIYLTNYLMKHHKMKNVKIDGMDPYTCDAYRKRIGSQCDCEVYKYNFEDIQNGVLWQIIDKSDANCYSLIVCCYALHLCKPSRLSSVCYCLSMVAKKLLIITPHKRPIIDEKMGWHLLFEAVEDKVRIRLYQSIYYKQ